MKKILFGILACVMLLNGCSKTSGEKIQPGEIKTGTYTIQDAQGTVVKLSQKPQRILTDSLGLDELVVGLTEPEKLVGINYLDVDENISFISRETAKHKNRLRSYTSEEIIALRPDVFLATTWFPQDKIIGLRQAGIPVVVCQGPTNIQEVKATVLLVAEVLKEKECGKNILAQMDEELEKIATVIKKLGKPWPKVLLVSLMSSYGGTGSLYDSLCERAGVINVISKVGLRNGAFLSKELIVKAQPDIFLFSQPSKDDAKEYEKYRVNFLADPVWQTIAAKKKVLVLQDKYIYCSSQNIIYGIKALANTCYQRELFSLAGEKCIKGW